MQIIKHLKTFDGLLASVIGFYAIYVIFTGYSGIGISPDSIMYASTARNIAYHGSLLTFNGSQLVFFPVFYPFFLAVILFITRIDTITAAPFVNALMFAAVIFFSGYIVTKFKSYSRYYNRQFIVIAVLLSPALLEIYSYLWSETLFILEIMLFILAYWRYMQTHATKNLLAVSILVALSCITRYAGVTLVGTGGLLILLDSQLETRKKIKHFLIFGFISLSLLVGNLLLNRLATGLSTGTREPSITPLSGNLYNFGVVLCDWMGLPKSAYPYSIAIACFIMAVILGIFIWRIYKKQVNTCETILIAFAVVYSFFIPVLASISRFEPLNSRLMSPAYVPLLIGCTSWVPDMLKGKKRRSRLLIALPFIIVMRLFQFSIASTDFHRWYDENGYGVPGYSDDDWNKSDFVAFLKTHKNIYKPGVPKYTDADEAAYLFGGTSAKLLPHRYFTNTVKQFFKVKHYYLIWFNALNNPELIDMQDILKHGGGTLKKLYVYPDGGIYEYTANQ